MDDTPTAIRVRRLGCAMDRLDATSLRLMTVPLDLLDWREEVLAVLKEVAEVAVVTADAISELPR